MALIPAKIIARVRGTSDAAELSWEWVMRADGQVSRRMTAVHGRPLRDSWQVVTQVPARERQMIRINHAHARAMLAGIARQRGHDIAGPSGLDRSHGVPPNVLAGEVRDCGDVRALPRAGVGGNRDGRAGDCLGAHSSIR